MGTDSEEKKKRLLVFIVAYNAERTIEDVLRRIPPEVGDHFDVEILIIDDASEDDTFERSELVNRTGVIPFKITVLFNPVNQGYGGNQKLGFHYAIKNDFDYVALLHGDGQYAPECLPLLASVLERGGAGAVFGSRMMNGTAALKGGMPLYKFIGNKILTKLQNFMLGSRLSEFHSGYRLYRISALKKIPFDLNSNDFHFDTEIIIQLFIARSSIEEVPIPTFYGDEICYVDGVKYARNVLLSTIQSKVQRYHIFYDRKFDCAPNSSGPSIASRPTPGEKAFLSTLSGPAGILVLGRPTAAFLRESERAGHRVSMNGSARTGELGEIVMRPDSLFVLDGALLSRRPERFVEKLKEYCSNNPDTRIVLVTGNVGFFLLRITHLFGRFSYTRRGVLSFRQFRFFTTRSLRKLFSQNGFEVDRIQGIPVDSRKVFDSQMLADALDRIQRVLIWIRPSLFAYQLMAQLRQRPTLDILLQHAYTTSARKARNIGGPRNIDSAVAERIDSEV